jgi:hypothetical protein
VALRRRQQQRQPITCPGIPRGAARPAITLQAAPWHQCGGPGCTQLVVGCYCQPDCNSPSGRRCCGCCLITHEGDTRVLRSLVQWFCVLCPKLSVVLPPHTVQAVKSVCPVRARSEASCAAHYACTVLHWADVHATTPSWHPRSTRTAVHLRTLCQPPPLSARRLPYRGDVCKDWCDDAHNPVTAQPSLCHSRLCSGMEGG